MEIYQLRFSKLTAIVGYIGVAIVFLSSAAYSIQVTLNPNAATGVLALTFCAINVVAWTTGHFARRNPQTFAFGTTLLVLGDVIFPLNLYAPFFLYTVLLKGNIFHSASTVLLVGVTYHLMGYLRRERRRFSVVFYPYFFAGSIATLLYLTRFTLNWSSNTIVWLLIGFALAYQAITTYGKLQPDNHFSFSTVGVLLANTLVTVMAFSAEPRGEYLLALFIIAVILFRLAWTTKAFGHANRFFGLAFFLALTTFFTACLYYFNSPIAGYIVATTLWVCLLTLMGIYLRAYRFYPFQEAAHWLSVFLGLALIFFWTPFWLVLTHIHFQLPVTQPLALPFTFQFPHQISLLAPISLIGVSVAFLSGSYWKRRHPSIAFTQFGLVFNVSFITITAYLPLLLLVAAGTGFWLAMSATVYGAALVPFIFAVIYLIISKNPNPLYPMVTLKVAGYIALLLSAFTAVYSLDLAMMIIFCSALLFLWRSVSERSSWMHLSFLFMVTAAASLATVRLPERISLLLLSLLSVGLVGIYRWLRFATKMHFEARLTLFWGFALSVTVAVVDWGWGQFSPVVFLPLWLGLLIGLGENQSPVAWEPGREVIDRQVIIQFKRLKMVGYWVAHLAGAAFVIAALQPLGLPVGYEALTLALWAWLHLGGNFLLPNRPSEQLARTALRQIIHGLALLSLLLAIINRLENSLPVIAAFLVAALYLFLYFIHKRRLLQDITAFAFIAAFYLLGMHLKIAMTEYYLSLFGLYLCFRLLRKAQTPAHQSTTVNRQAPASGRFKRGIRFVWKNLLPITIMVMMLGYPVWAFAESLHNGHVYYLGAATILLLYLFMVSRQPALLIYLVCLIFVQGAVYLLIFGESGEPVNLFLVIVGTMIIINQIFLSHRLGDEISNLKTLPVTRMANGD
ncbi:MAG: hypothetical protein AB1757_16420 [Acidobacteriota bacterium]